MIKELIRTLSNGGNITDILPGILFTVIVVVFSLSFHEASHGLIAYKLGDPTARNSGRLTLNPAKHLEPIGTICMLLFGFGWAKPVPVNPRYFKKPRNGMAITAIAGPISNLILSFISLIILRIIIAFSEPASIFLYFGFSSKVFSSLEFSMADKIVSLIAMLMYYFHIMNLYLAVFNLIPIPPLDGSRLAFIFLPDRIYFAVMKYERYIMLAMLVLLYTGFITGPLSSLCSLISNGMNSLLNLIPFLR